MYPIREHMAVVMPDWETVIPIWYMIFLPNQDKNKKYICVHSLNYYIDVLFASTKLIIITCF